jgi:predicted ferric reductase
MLLILAPLVVAALTGPTPTSRPFWTEVGVALGFVAFPLILLQFVLVSRLAAVSRPFGTDALMQWHRGMGLAVLAFLVLHPLLIAGVPWSAWNPLSGSVLMQTGAVAFWGTLLIVATSVWRRRLGLSYEAWQIVHLGLACLMTVTATWHILAARSYSASPAVRWILLGYVALCAALLLRYRFVRPLGMLRRPWTIEANRDIGGSVRLLRVRPDGHAGLGFEAGQFGWLITGSHPVLSEQHPLSFASSATPAADGAVEFAIKNLGDWSGQVVPVLSPGRRVWIDGPFGGFTPDLTSTRGLVLIAGGIGIAPMRSVLLTLRDSERRSPVWLFHAASNWSRVVFRDELAALADELNVQVCYVFENPDADWTGERGRITRDVLERHLPADRVGFDYFICGPVAMMDAVEGCLTDMGVPAGQVHTERFQMV